MNGLNSNQLKSLADFLNKIAAAWFAGGIISPLFTKPQTLIDKFSLPLVGLFFSLLFLEGSLIIAKRVQS